MPFDVTLQGPTENIAVSGRLHVTVKVRVVDGTTFVTVHPSLLDTVAFGETSGQTFHALAGPATTCSFLGAFEHADIEQLAFVVMMEQSRPAQDDVRAIMRLHFLSASEFIVTVEHSSSCAECTARNEAAVTGDHL